MNAVAVDLNVHENTWCNFENDSAWRKSLETYWNLLFLKKTCFIKKRTEYMVEHVFWDVNNAYYDRHMYIAWHDARCACFFGLKCVDEYRTACCAADQMKAMIMLKQSMAVAHLFTVSLSVRLLLLAPAWLSRRKKRRFKACVRQHVTHHFIVVLQRYDWLALALALTLTCNL